MSLISTSIPNLVNGVSQQPAALRLASQADEQINGYSSVVEGLRKRPPSRWIKRFMTTQVGNAFTHIINRDANERYIVTITNGDLTVHDLAGHQKGVHFPEGKDYLTCATPDQDFTAVTVADYTFILNKTRVTAKKADLSPSRPHEALIWVRQGNYSTRYSVHVTHGADARTVSYETPDSSHSLHEAFISTAHIAGELFKQLQAIQPNGWVVTLHGSFIHIHRADGSDFAIGFEDGGGDQSIKIAKGTVQRFSDLPEKAIHGFTVRVQGDQTSGFDDYWVKYDQVGTTGVWKETLKGGIHFRLQRVSMPHALVRNADGTFTFQVLDWAERETGDGASNPFPSFIGRPLNDIFFHRNRLGLIADENVVFSRAGDFFTFFKESATQLLDSDPIDIAVSHVKVSILRHAIPFNESLLLFSDQTQFMLAGGDLLTPQTAAINQTTEYQCSLRARPVGAGRNVYFAVNKGDYTGIREYYLDGDTETNDAADVTSHVPKYIPRNVVKLASSSNEDVLLCLSGEERNALYVYKYFWSGTEKLQSSWSKWLFSPEDHILNIDIIESTLYLVIQRPDGVHLESVPLEPWRASLGSHFVVHLDRRAWHGACAVSLDGEATRIVFPYRVGDAVPVMVVSYGGVEARIVGRGVENGKTVVRVLNDWTNTEFRVGVPYELRYTFSPFLIREEVVGGGQTTVGEGRLQVRNVSLTHANTGFFRVEVTPFRRDTYRYPFWLVVGSGQNLINRISLETGRFRFPVMSRNDQVRIEIVNDSVLPSHFLSAEWEAFHVSRSRRL